MENVTRLHTQGARHDVHVCKRCRGGAGAPAACRGAASGYAGRIAAFTFASVAASISPTP